MFARRSITTPALALLCLTALLSSGCSLSFEQDPATTVNIVISGIEGEDARQEVKSTLEDMTDGSGYMMSTSIKGSTMSITLSPVSDVDSFVKKINFGKVKNVEGRDIEIDYVP